MDDTTNARPAEEPERASALDGDDKINPDVVTDPDVAEARKRAGIALRKMTLASTMIYAGPRVSGSKREKAARAKPAATPPAVPLPDPAAPDAALASTAAVEAPPLPRSRKRLRTHAQFILRIADMIAGQLDAIDAITRDPHRGEGGPGEAERHARTVAALARVSAELRKELEADRRRRADDDDSARVSDRSVEPGRPRDLDELRARLSRRLDIRHRSGSAVSVGDDAAGRGRIPD